MKKLFTACAVLAAMCLATSAFAIQYPPGPSNCCPDTLTIINLQNPAAIPHPVVPDTVRGVGGIITGFDGIPTGFGFYIQMSNNLTYSGIDVFSGSTNDLTALGLALGDSVVVYGKCQEFGGGSEIEGFDNAQATNDLIVRKVSSGNPLPAFHVGTVSELQELPTNPNAEQWEGMLVKLNGPLKVARNSVTGGLGTNNSFLLVDPACPGPICDSVFVDGNTLTTYAPPAVGQTINSVQGIYDQRSRGYRIQLRTGNDLVDNNPPSVNDAYMVDANKVRVVFDRDVTTASATDIGSGNYTLASLGSVDAAVMDGQSAVILTITNGLAAGDPEAITINNIVGVANGLAMTTPATRNFTNGILTPTQIQGPNADSLVAATGCKDVANFLGGNNGGTARITTRGVCGGIQGSLYTLQNLAGGARGGVAVFAPITPLVRGHQYLIASALQEFPSPSSGETEIVGTQYIKDEGLVSEPAPVDITVHGIVDTTCDATQSNFNGEDVEGTIAKISMAKIVGNNGGSAFVAGGNFRVVDLGAAADTFFIANNITRTFLPVIDHVVDVTGIVQFSFGAFRMQPRGNADIVDHGPVSVIGTLPTRVTFAVFPNPARTTNLTFGLPVKNSVDIGVFDLAGRRVATIARGSFDAGTYTRQWNGLDDSGAPAHSGVYFYRMKVGTQTFSVRGIKLN